MQTDIPVRFKVTREAQCAARNRNDAAAAVADEVDILSFMDMDDFSCPTRIAEIEAAIQGGADVVIHSYRSIPRNRSLSDIRDWPVSRYSPVSSCFMTGKKSNHSYITVNHGKIPRGAPGQMHNGHISLRSTCWKTLPYPYGFIRCEDSQYNFMLYDAGFHIVYIPNVLSLYSEY